MKTQERRYLLKEKTIYTNKKQEVKLKKNNISKYLPALYKKRRKMMNPKPKYNFNKNFIEKDTQTATKKNY